MKHSALKARGVFANNHILQCRYFCTVTNHTCSGVQVFVSLITNFAVLILRVFVSLFLGKCVCVCVCVREREGVL